MILKTQRQFNQNIQKSTNEKELQFNDRNLLMIIIK